MNMRNQSMVIHSLPIGDAWVLFERWFAKSIMFFKKPDHNNLMGFIADTEVILTSNELPVLLINQSNVIVNPNLSQILKETTLFEYSIKLIENVGFSAIFKRLTPSEA
ncbi:uncharacterized protein ASCRUDRAFT_71120 [Ascoidea rubescens DSM 1968]|uniref:Uncharacterized protein n=1 Tax=Ascoidea rubescens DSM 1968 TaxID=1344418 RepID=A0A1D2VEN0_9ASCO|nr:hypothetical protein ASCRUDRAFT_71120 [Ascoidea rubescens DSM 1968]ODV60069.1 hypothetical protein ASCRUDRAFT_71120 [Ascoidea rubescens DSM 1968]